MLMMMLIFVELPEKVITVSLNQGPIMFLVMIMLSYLILPE